MQKYKKEDSFQYGVLKKLFIDDMEMAFFDIEMNVMKIANNDYKVNGVVQNGIQSYQIVAINSLIYKRKPFALFMQDKIIAGKDGTDYRITIAVKLSLKDNVIIFESSSLNPT